MEALQERSRNQILASLATELTSAIETNALGTNPSLLGEEGIVYFVRNVIGAEPKPYQEEILRKFISHGRVAVRSPHGVGKSCLASWLVLYIMAAYPEDVDVKVVTTASAWRQLEKFLWPEIRKWARKADWSKVGLDVRYGRELVNLSLRLPNKEAFAAASDNPELIEGAHATVVAYIFDEAKAIPDPTWDAAEGAFSQEGLDNHKVFAIAISTPGDEEGRFYEIHTRKEGLRDWWTRHVTLEEAIACGQISQEWADNRKRQWGEDSVVYRRRVLGEFASSAQTNVIPLSWIEKANERWLQWFNREEDDDKPEAEINSEAIGCDPARFGDDKTVIARFHNWVITSIERMSKMDTMSVANYLDSMDGTNSITMTVDVIGIGAGVVDRLRELGHPVIGVNTSEHTLWTDSSGELRFINLRSMLWWHMREYLDPSMPRDCLLAIPPDDDLTAELIIPRWNETQSGVIKVESKQDIRRRLRGKSTDCADAVMLAVYGSIVGSSSGIYV